MNIWQLLFILIVGGSVLLALIARAERDEKPRLPDCYGIFTKDEATRIFDLKERYEAGTLTDDDIDYFQTTWP